MFSSTGADEEYPDRILHVGAGEQGIMVGDASDETKESMPLTHSRAARLESC